MLDDLIRRGLRRPEFLIVDGVPGLENAIAAVWDGVPVQRCNGPQARTCWRMPPERLHEEITADYNDMICAATREVERGWRSRSEFQPLSRRHLWTELATDRAEPGDVDCSLYAVWS